MRFLNAVKVVLSGKIWRKSCYYLLAISCIVNGEIVAMYPVSASGCSDVQFIFARGSGEDIGGPSYTAWHNEIDKQMQESTMSYSFYELGSATQNGHKYPAVAVSGGSSGLTNMIGAAISGGELFNFGKSVDEGVAELKSYLASTSQSCPKTKFVLGGYSQGAMLLSRTLGELDSTKIIYVSTFGDPKIYLPEGKMRFLKKPDACYGRNLSNYRINVSDCYAHEGILGSYQPYQPEDYVGKIGTWCNKSDIMCSSRMSISDHTSYISDNLYAEAATIVVAKVFKFFNIHTAATPSTLHEVAFLVDNTASMRLKQQKYQDAIGDFAERIVKGSGRIALYEFGDLAQNVKTLERCGFGCKIEDFRQSYKNIGATGGGDDPESALSGLMTTMNSLQWTNGATKSIVLLTDNGYHNPDFDGVTLDDVVKRSLEIDPVNVYVINTGFEVEEAYGDLVVRTNGGFIKPDSNANDLSEQLLTRPVAKLKLTEYSAEPGDTLEFDASDSFAENGDKLRFDWDLDGDDVFEKQNADATITQTYPHSQDDFIQVKVTDTNQHSATMSARVKITKAEQVEESAKITEFSLHKEGDSNLANFTTIGTGVLLVANDTPLGWVEVSSGAGKFTIDDLAEETHFALIPYSAAGVRGERYDFEIGTHASSTDASLDQEKPSLDQISKNIILPKVPNAGIYSKDR